MPPATPGTPRSRAPLAGYRVGITADRGRHELAEAFEAAGAETLWGAAVASAPLGRSEALDACTEEAIADPPSVLVLTSSLGVEAWLSRAEHLGHHQALVAALGRSRVFVLAADQGAAAALGAAVDGVLPDEPGSALGRLVEAVGDLDGRPVWVQTDEGGRGSGLVEALGASRARLVEVSVPRSGPPADPAPALGLVEAVVGRRVHALAFSEPAEVRNLVGLADGAGAGEELSRALGDGEVLVACYNSSCARAAAALGTAGVVQPERTKVGALVESVVDGLAGRVIHLELAGVDVALRGDLAVIDGEEVWLAPREQGLLAALARCPGTVVAKAELLRLVWGSEGSEGADAHAVEVAVARLRRRLGAAGAGLQTVPRRGYRLVSG